MIFKYSNLDKPKNKTWKYVSKFLTRTLPAYAAIIAAVPDMYLSAEIKIWIAVGLSAVVATISSLSEFTTDVVIEPVGEPIIIEDETTI